MKKVGLSSCGTLPAFGNFGDYDRYQGVKELMPFAKAVSAKSHHFDADGNETSTDYRRMMKIVDGCGNVLFKYGTTRNGSYSRKTERERASSLSL